MGKKSGPWFCPKIVSGLLVDYSYSLMDDEDCSLQTIEEDDEDALDVDSNPPINEVTDDLEQLHTSQVLLQLRLPSDDVTHADCDRFELPPSIPPSIVEVTHCSTSCQQQKNFSQMNEASPTSIDSLAGPPLPPYVRILSEIGQPSKAAMDTSNAPAMDFPSISCPFCDSATVHDLQGEKEFSNVTGMHPNSHLDNHEQPLIPFSDPMITLQGDRNDISMDMAAGCSDPEEQHSPENDNLNPVVAIKETSSLQPDGFQLVQKKGLQKSRKPSKDHMEHHQDRPRSSKGRSSH
ncbi:hypothetical protein Dimus_022804 [Dionaea muscipula]